MPPHRTLEPARTLGDASLGQGGQILALAFSPGGGRLAVLGNHHVVGVFDAVSGRIAAALPCQAGLRFVAFDGEEHLLGFDQRGVVRLAFDGSTEVVIACPSDRSAEYRVEDVVVRGATTALVESPRVSPHGDRRARLFRAGASVATITYALADVAEALGLASIERCALSVEAVALAPDGGRLVALAHVVCTEEGPQGRFGEAVAGAVLVHDAGGRLLRASLVAVEAVAPGSFSGDVAFAPDGRTFAVASGSVRTFDGESGALLHTTALQVAGRPVDAREVAILGSGELLVASETHIGRWAPGASEATAAREYRYRAFVLAMAASPTTVAIADDRALLWFTLPELTPVHEPVGHTNAVNLLAVDRTGARVASADRTSLIVWDVAAGAPRFQVAARSWAGLAFSPDGRELITPLDGHHPHVFDADTGEIRVVGEAAAMAIQWGDRVTCLHYDEVIVDDEVGAEIVVSEGREARETARMHGPYVRCMPALSRDGRRALFWSDRDAYGWDLERRTRLWARPFELVQAALSPDGALALVTRIAAPPAVIDMMTGEVRLELTDIGETISWAVAWSATLDRLAVGVEGDVYVIEFAGEPGREQAPRVHLTRLCADHRPEVTATAFSGDGTVIATAGAEGTIHVFELGPARLVEAMPPPQPPRSFAPGAACRLKRGALARFPATVLSVDDAQRTALLEVEVLGDRSLVEAALDDLE